MQRDVLYIGQDRSDTSIFDRGSRACMEIIDASDIDVLVQNVNVLQEKKVTLPDWLNGTPSFVDVSQKQVYRGTHAIQRMREKMADVADDNEQSKVHATDSGAMGNTHDELQGITAAGNRLAGGDGDNFDSISDIPSAQSTGGAVREGAVTESELQAFIQERNSVLPSGGSST